jgi:hypothetical protein
LADAVSDVRTIIKNERKKRMKSKVLSQ